MNNLLSLQHLEESFKGLHPMTFEGKSFIDKYKNFDSSSYIQTYSMLCEGANSRDRDVRSWAKKCQAKISTAMPYSFQVGYALEEAKSSLFGQSMNEEFGYLTTWKEKDVVAAIKNGIFESAKSILPRFNSLHESLCSVPEPKRNILGEYAKFNPISCIHESAGCHYFMVEGKTFKESLEGICEEAEAPSTEFAETNQAISELPYDADQEIFSLTMLPGAVNVTKKGKVTINGEEVDGEEFAGAMSNAISECADPNKRAWNARMADNITRIMENFDKLCVLDNVVTVKNRRTDESWSIMSHDNAYFVLENTNASKSFTKHISINESVNLVKTFTGVSLFNDFAKKCINEQKEIEEVGNLLKTQDANLDVIEAAIKDLENQKAIAVQGTPHYKELEDKLEQLYCEKDKGCAMKESFEKILASVRA